MKSNVIAGLQELGLDLQSGDFFDSGRNSVRGPCPQCGGTRRFVLFVDKDFPSWWGMCDECPAQGWLNQLFPHRSFPEQPPLPPEELKKIATKEKRAAVARRIRQEQALAGIRTSKCWETYHQNMADKDIAWWTSQGVPPEWQKAWQLGKVEGRSFSFNKSTFVSDAYVIPKFGPKGALMNLDYRLVKYPKKGGKYRPEKDLRPYPFVIVGDDLRGLAGKSLIVEGSKKAMVTYINQSIFANVYGVPSCNSWAGVDALVQTAEEVVVLFDPGALHWAQKLATTLNGNIKVLAFPTKIDDAFTKYGLTAEDFATIVQWARPPYQS